MPRGILVFLPLGSAAEQGVISRIPHFYVVGSMTGSNERDLSCLDDNICNLLWSIS